MTIHKHQSFFIVGNIRTSTGEFGNRFIVQYIIIHVFSLYLYHLHNKSSVETFFIETQIEEGIETVRETIRSMSEGDELKTVL